VSHLIESTCDPCLTSAKSRDVCGPSGLALLPLFRGLGRRCLFGRCHRQRRYRVLGGSPELQQCAQVRAHRWDGLRQMRVLHANKEDWTSVAQFLLTVFEDDGHDINTSVSLGQRNE
jgi:hypothetical protein